jgi:dolichol-phosphate hexosyltransferase
MSENEKSEILIPETITIDIVSSAEQVLRDTLTIPFFERRRGGRRASDRIISDRILNENTLPEKKITVLIPCYNEEKGIGKVIEDVPVNKLLQLGYRTEIVVINNNSSDNTLKIAMQKGARIVTEKKQGKGNAIRTGFKSISEDTDFVIMLDGDNTYKSNEIPRLIEPLENGFCDVVLGSRLGGKLNKDALSFSHRLANWMFTFIARRFYLVNITDTCTGYFAWKKKVVDDLIPNIESDGFAIEAEMITKVAKLGYNIYSVPITYDQREGSSKLSPYLDGLKILSMLIKNIAWKPSHRYENIDTAQNYFDKNHLIELNQVR